MGACRISLTFFESTAILSLLTICPNNAPVVTSNTYLARFKLNHAVRHFSKHIRRWSRCIIFQLYMVKSSRKTCMNARMYFSNISIMMRWNIAGVVFSSNIITTATKNSPFHYEYCLLLVIGMHPNVVVSIVLVKETIHLVSCYDIKYPVCKW